MSAPKGASNPQDPIMAPNIDPPAAVPQQTKDHIPSANYGFFVKAICVNLCFMCALTMFIIAIGFIFSLVSSSGHNLATSTTTTSTSTATVATAPMSRSAQVPQLPQQTVSVQHFQHLVQNGNQMANQLRYVVPEAQQMLNDAIRIFYEAMFKVNSIFVPDVPADVDLAFPPPAPLLVSQEGAAATTESSASREKRDLRDRLSVDEESDKISMANFVPPNVEGTCDYKSSNLAVMRKIFGSEIRVPAKAVRSGPIMDTLFDVMDIDPMHFSETEYDENEDEDRDTIKIRRKRKAAPLKYRQLKEEYVRCKKLAVPSEKCDNVFREVVSVLKSLNSNFNSAQELWGKSSNGDPRSKTLSNGGDVVHSVPTVHPNRVADPQFVQPPNVGFHEEMGRINEDRTEPRQWNDPTRFINQFTNQKIHNMASSSGSSSSSSPKFGQNSLPLALNSQSSSSSSNANTANNGQKFTNAVQVNTNQAAPSEMLAASGPFLSLCEKYARQGTPSSADLNPLNTNQQSQNHNHQNNGNQMNNNNNNNNNQNQNQPSFIGFTSWPAAAAQFSNKGNGVPPLTGESMQATAKVLFNPGVMGVAQNPVCFTAVPVQQRLTGNMGFVNINGINQNGNNNQKPGEKHQSNLVPPKRNCKSPGTVKCNIEFLFPTQFSADDGMNVSGEEEPNSSGIQPRASRRGSLNILCFKVLMNVFFYLCLLPGNGITYVAVPTSFGAGGLTGNQLFRNQIITAQG